MIAVEHLKVRVGGFALEDIGFDVPTGQYAVLMGRTGALRAMSMSCGMERMRIPLPRLRFGRRQVCRAKSRRGQAAAGGRHAFGFRGDSTRSASSRGAVSP